MKRKLTREELLAGYASVHDVPQAADPRFKSPDELLSRVAPKKTSDIVPEVKMPIAPAPIEIKPAPKAPVAPLKSAEEKIHYAMPDLATLRTELEKERTEQTAAAAPQPAELPLAKESIQIERTGFSPLFATAEFKMPAKEIAPEPVVDLEEINRKHQEEIRQWKEYSAGVKAWQAQVMDIVEKLKKQASPSKEKDDEIKNLKSELEQIKAELHASRQKDKMNILGWMKNFARPTPSKPH